VRVTVDPARCQGHARCIAFAPETFDLDDEGYSFVRPGCADVAPEREASVARAVENCPEQAIAVDADAPLADFRGR
jgi:ferredoxin